MSDEVQQAVKILLRPVADLIYRDPHQWSQRPCATCRAVTSIIGEPFGCDRYRKEKQERKP